jgi:uncharacterized protein YjdB
MENLNSGSIYKLASIKWLLVTLLIGFSCVAFADNSNNDYVVQEHRGSWSSNLKSAWGTLKEVAESSIEEESAMTNIIIKNPKMTFTVVEDYAYVDISLSDDSESMQPNESEERDCSKLHTNTILYLYEGTGKDIKLLGSNDDYGAGEHSGRFSDQFSNYIGNYTLCDDESGFGNLMLGQGTYTAVAGISLSNEDTDKNLKKTLEKLKNKGAVVNPDFLLRIGAKPGAIRKDIDFSECNKSDIYCIDLSGKNKQKQEVNLTFYLGAYGRIMTYHIPYKPLALDGTAISYDKNDYSFSSSDSNVVNRHSFEVTDNSWSFKVKGIGKTNITITNKKNPQEYVEFTLKVNAPQFSFKFSKSTVDVSLVDSKAYIKTLSSVDKSYEFKATRDNKHELLMVESSSGFPHIILESNDPVLKTQEKLDALELFLGLHKEAPYSISSSDERVVKIVNNTMQFLKPGSSLITLQNTIHSNQFSILQVTVKKDFLKQEPLKIAQWLGENRDPSTKASDYWKFRSADKILEIEISGGSGAGDLILDVTNKQTGEKITDIFKSYAVKNKGDIGEEKWIKIPPEGRRQPSSELNDSKIKNQIKLNNKEGGKVRLKLKLKAQYRPMAEGRMVLNVYKESDNQYFESAPVKQTVFLVYSEATAGFLTEAQNKWNQDKGEFSDPEYTAIIPYNKENKYQHDGDRPSIQISEFLSSSKVTAEKENVKKDIKYFLYVNNQKVVQGYSYEKDGLVLSVNENTGELTYSGVIPESENNQFRVCTEIVNGYHQNSSRYFANLKFNFTSENKEWDFKHYFIQNCYKFNIEKGEQKLVRNDPYLENLGGSFNVLDEPYVSLTELIDNKSSGDGQLIFKSNNSSCASIYGTQLEFKDYGCQATITVYKAATKNWLKSDSLGIPFTSKKLSPVVTFKTKSKKIPFIKSKENGLNFAASFDNKKFKGYSIKYASSDTNVATIDKNGIVKVDQAGDTTITVTASGFGYVKQSKEYAISFVETPLEPNFNLNLKKNIGFTDDLIDKKLSVAPSKQSGIKYKYTSSDSNVAVVDVEGNVTVKKAGQATITVTASGYGYSKVTKDYELNFVRTKLVPNVSPEISKVGFTEKPISFDVKGFNSLYQNITYKSSDPDVAIVNKKTGEITLKELGNVQVTATVKDNDNFLSLGASKVEITHKYEVIQGTLDIEINSSNPKLIEKTLDNDPFYMQDHIKNHNEEFKYSYKHRSVNLEISSKGLVNISKDGEYTIQITRVETEKYKSATAYIVINVSPFTSKITVNTHQKELDGAAVKVSLDFNVEEDKVENRNSLLLYLAYDDKKLNFNGIHKDTLGFPKDLGKPILEFPYDDPDGLLLSIKDYKAESVNKEVNPNGQKWYSKFKKLTNAPSTVQVEWSEDTRNGYIFDGIDGKKPIDLLSALFERRLGFKSGSTEVAIIQRIESSKSEFVLRKIGKFKINADQEPDASDIDESDSKANPDTSNTDESNSGVVDSKVIEKTVKRKFVISNNEEKLDISSLKKSLSWKKDDFKDCNIYVSSTKFPDPSTEKREFDTHINQAGLVDCSSGDIINLNSLTLDDHKSYYVILVARRHGEESSTYSQVDQFRYDKLILSGEQVNSTGGRTKHVIEWQYHSTLETKKISLYYDPDAEGNDGKAISDMASGLSIEDGTFTWDTSQIPEGEYYLYAKVSDKNSSQSEVYYSENPITIEHDHGLAMDCSAMFNYPGGHLKAPYQCNEETLALRGPSGKVIFVGKQNNLKPERHEENVLRVYPSQSNFLIVKEDGHNSFYYNRDRSSEGNFTQNMTISSKEDAFIGVDKDNNIALNYPITGETYVWEWLDDFKKYKALSSYDDSKKEDLINNGSIASLIYQLPLKFGGKHYQISESNFVDGDVFTSVVTNLRAKAALTKEGRIKIWGHHDVGGVIFSGEHANSRLSYIDKMPDLNKTEFDEIYPGQVGFSAIKKDKSIIYWGFGQYVDPMNMYGSWIHVKSKIGDNFNKVFVNNFFYGVKSDGSVKVWSESFSNDLKLTTEIESVSDIKHIYTAELAVTLEDKKGDLYWIPTDRNYENPKLEKIEHSGFDNVFTKIYSNEKAFAGITAEGRIQSWGNEGCGGANANAPIGSGYVAIYSTYCSFVAVKADGTYTTWGKMGFNWGTLLSPKQIEITPKDIQYDAENANLQFSVRYTTDTKRIPSMTLYIYYDDSKLDWNGLERSSVWGYSDPEKVNSEESAMINEDWKSTRYGEFGGIHHLYGDNYNSYTSVFERGGAFDDRDNDTKAVIALRWRRPSTGKGTFEGGSTGFVPEIPNNLKLFQNSFKLKEGFQANESTRINFRIGDGVQDTKHGGGYPLSTTSIIIEKENNGDVSFNLSKKETILR